MIEINKNLPGFHGIVFDLDGTLLDTVPDSCAALNRVFDEDGLHPLNLAEIRTTVGEGARTMLQRALAIRQLPTDDEALIDDYVNRYMQAYLADPTGHTVIYPGVRETIAALLDTGMILGVCTNKPRATTRVVLERIFPEQPFAAILCPEDVSHRKPDGRHVLATIAAMGVPPARTVMVGDSETDIDAAVDAGIVSVGVTYGYCHAPLETLPADATVDSFAELPETFERLATRRWPA
jgi:phosphoglycolate phosphatase